MVVAEHMSTIGQLKKEVSFLKAENDQLRKDNDNLRVALKTKRVKEEGVDPLALVKDEPESSGELHM